MMPFVTGTSTTCSTSNTTRGCIKAELDSLLAFKAEIIYDKGDPISSWGVQTDDCCQWAGVQCNKKSGHVVGLNLQRKQRPSVYVRPSYFCDVRIGCDDWCLRGNISQSGLTGLHHLKYLDLSYNFFSNISIPKWLGSLKNLVHLDLSYSRFIGVIPHELGNLTRLRYLNLATYKEDNYKVDDAEWLSGLSSLRYLLMDHVNFFGVNNVIQSLNKLQNLEYVSLFDCSMDSIPESLPYLNFTFLTVMNIGHNMFNDTRIPEWLFRIPNLRELYVESSGLTGAIPESLGRLSGLQDLYLGGNELNGPIPKNLSELSNLVHLDLSDNNFNYSTVITEAHLANLTSLKFLSLNQLALTISIHWIPVFQAEQIYLSYCRLGPNFPFWLANQVNLVSLDMSNNGIKGSIPDWFWNIMHNISLLDLSNNEIHGILPQRLRFQASEYSSVSIFLGSNHFEGSVPYFPSNVQVLDLSNNSLSGTIPPDLGYFGGIGSQLKSLSLSSNNLTGGIPNSFCNLVDLELLELPNNHLEGEIPNCWNNLTGLQYLILANNSLAGEVPNSLGSSSQSLQVLHLSNNQLHGEFPSFLKNCTSMTTLALDHNNLSGKVPSWVGETMTSLMILTLKQNNFTGKLPLLSNLTPLHFLDLSHNTFVESIPQSYGNLMGMIDTSMYGGANFSGFATKEIIIKITVLIKGSELEFGVTLSLLRFIDLSRNQLSGQIPKDMVNLVGLQNLDLSCNHLSGEIPRNIGLMQSLESLDLSRNELIGSIPTSLSTLHFLGNLNLSHNNLSGEIPYAGQLTTFNNPSIYASNLNLCGAPLDKNCTSDEPPSNTHDQEDDDDNDNPPIWFWIGLMLGFVVGFWIVWGILLFKKEWRHVYFRFLDHMYDMMYVKIVVTVPKIKRALVVLRSM